ncbi:MAG TPA: hypothetical protein VG405_01530 [Solirubrobacteraceae bacterium]|jgi:hypothetical protein|nr:hypothetical protein [Solirubrobacteraceae bacterium]
MSYTTQSGREQILQDVAEAAEELGNALAALSEAYEHLDDQTAERMEDGLFRPLQGAFGQLKRTHEEFARRYDLRGRDFPPAPVPLPGDARRLFERASESIQSADDTLAALQDSLLPVEVGDEALRAGLSSVRLLLAPLPLVSSQLVSRFGR